MPRIIKALSAGLLLVSVGLPMSTCAGYEDARGQPIRLEDGEAVPEGATLVARNRYALESFEPLDLGDWGTMLAFLWPSLAMVLLTWRRRGLVALGIRFLEPILLWWSWNTVDFISSFLSGARAVGAYLAFVGLAVYAIGTFWADVGLFREWNKPR